MSFAANALRPTAAPTILRGAPRSFGGWAFQRIAALYLQESPGLLAEVAARSALVRQAIFAAIARIDERNSAVFVQRLNSPHLGEALRRGRARELVGATFEVERVPMTYLRALSRIGDDPLDNPDHYTRLWHMTGLRPARSAIAASASPTRGSSLASSRGWRVFTSVIGS